MQCPIFSTSLRPKNLADAIPLWLLAWAAVCSAGGFAAGALAFSALKLSLSCRRGYKSFAKDYDADESLWKSENVVSETGIKIRKTLSIAKSKAKEAGYAKTALFALAFSLSAYAGIAAAESFAIPAVSAGIPFGEAALSPPESVLLAGKPEMSVSERVSTVLADVKSDHPNQGCVTLEQSVRRMEGLERGIPLDHSESLVPFNREAHLITVDPHGKIVSALEKLGLLLPGQSIDSVAGTLTETDISNVLERAYAVDFGIPPDVSVPWDPAPTALSAPLPQKNEFPYEWLFLPAAAVAAGAFGKWKKKEDPGLKKSSTLNEPKGVPEVRESILPIVESAENPNWSLGRKIVTVHGFEFAEGEGISAHPNLGRVFGILESVGGKFIVSESVPVSSATPISVCFAYSDGHIDSVPIDFFGESDSPIARSRLETAFLNAFADLALKRDRKYWEDFRKTDRFLIRKTDLSSIYRRLESPEVVSTGKETGGFWFTPVYFTKDRALEMKNLWLPDFQEIDATSVEFAIKEEHWPSYAGRNAHAALEKHFSKAERSLLDRAVRLPKIQAAGGFAGVCEFFNWHKHPGGPLGPSGSDLNHPDAAPGRFEDSPGTLALTFTIVNEIPKNAPEPPWNGFVFESGKFGGRRDYLATFWRLDRILEAEAEKRRKFISEHGLSQGVALGICNRSGTLIHLDRKILTPAGSFWPDLKPMKIEILE